MKPIERYFHEEQRIRQLGLRLAVLAAALPPWMLLFGIVFEPVRTNVRALSAILFTWFSVGVVLPAFVTALKLTTEVRRDGVYFCFSPIHVRFRRIGLDEIVRFEALRYRPILQYGGWGIRIRHRRRAYSVSGDRGVRITLTDGRTVLFGSQRAETFAEAIARACVACGLEPPSTPPNGLPEAGLP